MDKFSSSENCSQEPNPSCTKNKSPNIGMLPSKRRKKLGSKVDKENLNVMKMGCVPTLIKLV